MPYKDCVYLLAAKVAHPQVLLKLLYKSLNILAFLIILIRGM